jgi:hypothetical protein
MLLGEVIKDPDIIRAIAIDWATYIPPDTISGSPAWSVANGLAIEGTPTFVSNVATAKISGGQEGADYLVTCRVTLSSGATEDGTVMVRVRTGEKESRLTR